MINDTLTPHPYAACYPLVSGLLEETLYDSIKINGLRQPIVLWRDEARARTWIIDGRNRYRALTQLQGGIKADQVLWRSYENDEEVRLAVLDYNENRRQMSTAQKSVVAGRILEARATLLSALETKAPQEPVDAEMIVSTSSENPEGGKDDDVSALEAYPPPFDPDPPHSEPSPQLRERAARACPPEVRREVASTLGIGAKTAQRGVAVVSRGAPQLISALEEGLVSVEAAFTLTQLDDDELDSVVAQGKEGMRERARELKGAELSAKREEKQRALLGEIEVERMRLSWTEIGEEEEARFDLEITDPEQLRALLSLLTQWQLRGRREPEGSEERVGESE